MDPIIAIVQQLADKFPVLVSVLTIIGSLRVVIKPVMSIAQAWAAQTESKTDDEILQKVEASTLWKGVLWVVDYVFSVKPIKKA